MKFFPLEDRLLIKPDDVESVSPGGIILPEATRARPIKGTVVSVGPGRVLESGEIALPTVKVGDTVIYGQYAGSEVEIQGEKRLILRESELLGYFR